ncbi:PREDICTED: uncharacterized protein LOC109471959 isoform X1 [Branchiostoma belcheri]|uniref:Uncharacterized protein LOC109471959 isoform X1 n=1 Tax=Branchiostoma belcheri TaxID=7741 RepID=A0A6P4YZE5_BRABE|nr:PREDICTED: uncharacterized protein LOC109471959 isoform X1 [Branchiostoma belcheri]
MAQRVLWENQHHVAFLDPAPSLRGATVVMCKDREARDLWTLAEEQFGELMLATRQVAQHVTAKLKVGRCAMVADSKVRGGAHTLVLPLDSLGNKWAPVLAKETEFNTVYPGYITTKSGPRAEDSALDVIQSRILQANQPNFLGNDEASQSNPKLSPDMTFYGEASDDNLFARIVRGELQQWRIWEDRDHVAFLTPFPNTPGYTVVVPRAHLSSDILSLPTDAYIRLLQCARTVGLLIQKGLNTEGFAIVCEGMEIDYAHVKVIPVHTTTASTEPLEPEYMETYVGFLTSRPGPPASVDYLDKIELLLKMQ